MNAELNKEILKAIEEIKSASFDGKGLSTNEMEVMLLACLAEEEG